MCVCMFVCMYISVCDGGDRCGEIDLGRYSLLCVCVYVCMYVCSFIEVWIVFVQATGDTLFLGRVSVHVCCCLVFACVYLYV